MIDISKEEVLVEYLKKRNIIKINEEYSFRYLGGGVSCTVIFLWVGDREIIIKQALEQLKTKEVWKCDPNRMNIEYESNRVYHELVPECAPEVYFYDEENYIYGREALPEDWRMWKEDLLKGLLNFSSSAKVIDALSTVHNSCAGDKEVKKIFENKEIFYQLRVSPYIEFVVGKHPELSRFSEEVNGFLMDESITLVHGDFSPKNIMTDGEAVSVLDHEVAHYGHPAFDLAFFSTHFVLKAVKNKAWAAAYLVMLSSMLDRYFKNVTFMDRGKLESDYVKTWAFIILARVDGKSPAEYIVEDFDKELVRKIAFRIFEAEDWNFDNVVFMIREEVEAVLHE